MKQLEKHQNELDAIMETSREKHRAKYSQYVTDYQIEWFLKRPKFIERLKNSDKHFNQGFSLREWDSIGRMSGVSGAPYIHVCIVKEAARQALESLGLVVD